jgi:hypothetical protein
MKVPSPTLCPECRYIRRLLDRNEYNLYRRTCDATGENILSIYKPEVPFPVYKQEYWKSDAWDELSYGKDFDFSRTFFEQYEDLRRATPHVAMVNSSSVNSEYTNQAQDNKDCYMLFTSGICEQCIYGSWNQNSYMCGDCYMAEKSQFCYECININKCSNCIWSQDCVDCVNVYLSADCRGCTDCFGCIGLRSKQYYWFNENVGRDEYKKRLTEFGWTQQSISEMKEKFLAFRSTIPLKYYHGAQAVNSTGDYIDNMENARYAFNCRGHKDTAYMQDAWDDTADCMDCTEIIKGELAYEVQGIETPHRAMVIRSCFNTITDSYYCDMCFGVSNCFGCFGLKQKKYCILNKQYTKEEYTILKEKIIEHMRQTLEWGEYFPSVVSPFAYNESMAQDYFPLTKEEALIRGYSWYDRPESNYQATMTSDQIPHQITETEDSIINKIIRCKTQENTYSKKNNSQCATAFKLTPLELVLYRKLGVPVPEYCFPCRRTSRFTLRNPRRLWDRTCMCKKTNHFHGVESCVVDFKTSYAPDRPEIIYCEKCYQAEIL